MEQRRIEGGVANLRLNLLRQRPGSVGHWQPQPIIVSAAGTSPLTTAKPPGATPQVTPPAARSTPLTARSNQQATTIRKLTADDEDDIICEVIDDDDFDDEDFDDEDLDDENI